MPSALPDVRNNFNAGVGGWNPDASGNLPGYGGITPSVGGWNIDSSGSLSGGGFWPGVGGVLGFAGRGLGSIGAGLFNGIRNGLGNVVSGFGNVGGGGSRDDPTDPNNMANYRLGRGGVLGGNRTLGPTGMQYNAGRSAFGPTFQQINNPGSAIGPKSGGISNPYDPNSTHGSKPSQVTTSIPGWAAAHMASIRARNQL